MDKLKILSRVKQLYLQNTNIIKYLKEIEGDICNSIEDIMISYDFQAGTYIKAYKKESLFINKYCFELAQYIDNLGEYNSLLEVGIGEATTLAPLILSLENKPNKCYGFDISWSRIKYAKKFLNELKISNVQLFTGDLFCTPFKDNSIDVVYTSHSIEPNGGKEKEALMELYRITNKYLILLEPSYEFANEESRERMLNHGYVTNLYSTAKELGYNVIEHKLFEICSNPLNPTGIIIIKKDLNFQVLNPLCCPITKTDFLKKNNAYFSEESLLAYPIIDEIPCLLPQNAIIATKFLD
ncbi:methyltransferase domain-containing protein [Clostridium estertheticum]|uniref:methyltransferase domain-containing protein n=1 Tax=Clostridium estertheticum TaxID=238834 RepID=UPI001C0B8631|nr:methyltransferase domain-containing protein [Clostridium estertheticum]MBU3074172.1 methyltransferase domain-containing protein [Clostridium estertheticum]MBU3164266.1 methyltransferase domain-containing protein [Clostridium estertheticum]